MVTEFRPWNMWFNDIRLLNYIISALSSDYLNVSNYNEKLKDVYNRIKENHHNKDVLL